MYPFTVLTAAQCQALHSLAAGDQVAIDTFANPGKRGPVLAVADGMEYLVAENGSISVHEGEGIAA